MTETSENPLVQAVIAITEAQFGQLTEQQRGFVDDVSIDSDSGAVNQLARLKAISALHKHPASLARPETPRLAAGSSTSSAGRAPSATRPQAPKIDPRTPHLVNMMRRPEGPLRAAYENDYAAHIALERKLIAADNLKGK